MSITIQQLKKIAKLARIELTPEEEKRHAETMSVVLDYMKVLDEVDTHGVEPTSQVTGLVGVVREDVVCGCEYVDELVGQMPEVEFGKLKVPGVFE